jgi:N-methylhydantoinase A
MRVGADVGGTFTDVVTVDVDGTVSAHKVPSTPHAFDVAVVSGVVAACDEAGSSVAAVRDFRHGTTVATNAVLQRSGPLTALITTRGFRDVLELGRLRTPALYDLDWRKPVPLVERRYRLELDERTDASGRGVLPPDVAALEPALRALVDEGVVSLAVSLLNAYAGPAHEEQVAAWLEERFPELDVTVATRFVREIGEYERTSTAVANAYLRPVVAHYLQRLEEGLREQGATVPVFVMQSSGGMMPVAESSQFPAHLLESGPAAGVLAAADVARSAGLDPVISFDMGGTTAKASLIERHAVTFANEFSVGSDVSAASQLLKGGGYTVHLPVVDLAEVGAGGGSIARVDAGLGLHVGPESAGAVPGPACYSRGGDRPTVTDANLVLGYLNADGLRAAGIDVDEDRARSALSTHIAGPLGLSVEDAALAVHAVADRQMARVLRAVTTERGRDVSAHTIVAFGGSGPLHAATMAETVGVRSVVVPPLAGLFSAVGLLTAPFELTTAMTVGGLLEPAAATTLARLVHEVGAEAQARFVASGADTSELTVRQVLDVRYVGQASELPVDVTDELDERSVTSLVEEFHALHKASYGHALSSAVEMVRLRTTVTGGRPAQLMNVVQDASSAIPKSRQVHVAGFSGQVPVLRRTDVAQRVEGPFLIDDADTTTVVPPGWVGWQDDGGNIRLECEK